MNSIKKSIVINAPFVKVWGLLADVRRTPEWVDGVKESERTGAVTEGKGLRWRESCELDRQHIEVEHEMTEWEPMSRAVIESKLPMNGSMTRALTFSQTATGVQVAVEFAWDLGIAGMLLGAAHGASAVPADWVPLLHGWPGITGTELADRAEALAAGSVAARD